MNIVCRKKPPRETNLTVEKEDALKPIDQMQKDRTERAIESLSNQTLTIEPQPAVDSAQVWQVTSGKKEPYQVAHNDHSWSCTCPDFTYTGPEGIHCKHIQAVRLSIHEISPQDFTTPSFQEEPMPQELFDSALLAVLSAPFHPSYIEWKPQVTTKDNKRALAAAYVDPRHYQHRLDQIVPGWQTEYQFIKPDGSLVKCRLTIHGITREDVGESDAGENNTATSAVAQSFKRTCAAFGLGRYLYFLPQVWCDYDGQAKRITTPPPLPDWALPSGSGYPLENQAERKETHKTNSSTTSSSPSDTKKESEQKTNPQANSAEKGNTATVIKPGLSFQDASKMILTLKPKSRPELSGKTLGEVLVAAPDILSWLADKYDPTPETQPIKDAAQILVTSKMHERQILHELGYGS